MGKLFPHGLTGIIFDCDGVMIDSRAANAIFYNKVLAALGLPPLTPEQDAYTFMATARQALEYIVPPEMHQRMYEVVRTEVIYSRDIVPLLQIYPGYREFLELAHGHGMRLAVHTNRTAEGMQRVLDFLALPSYFNPVVTATEAAPKPAPDGVRLILEQWGADPEQVLFVGDSPNDQKAATAAGVVFAAFGHSPQSVFLGCHRGGRAFVGASRSLQPCGARVAHPDGTRVLPGAEMVALHLYQRHRFLACGGAAGHPAHQPHRHRITGPVCRYSGVAAVCRNGRHAGRRTSNAGDFLWISMKLNSSNSYCPLIRS